MRFWLYLHYGVSFRCTYYFALTVRSTMFMREKPYQVVNICAK